MDPILSPNITAYRKNHSCDTTLLRLVGEWKKKLDCGKVIAVLSTDMSKAFNSLYSPLPVKKLEAYNFSAKALELKQSHFNQRKNRVQLGPVYSQWKEYLRGCPQGSCFGPCMWNLSQNDLNYNMKSCNISMYADDHQVYVTGTSMAQVQSQLRFAGNHIKKWYEQNLLQVNGKKYQAMLQNIEGKENGTSIDSLCGNEIVGHSDKVKLLGVTIDNQLNFSENISQLCQKASRQVDVSMRMKKLVPERAKLVFYRSSILPHLTYCQKIWHFARASNKRIG